MNNDLQDPTVEGSHKPTIEELSKNPKSKVAPSAAKSAAGPP